MANLPVARRRRVAAPSPFPPCTISINGCQANSFLHQPLMDVRDDGDEWRDVCCVGAGGRDVTREMCSRRRFRKEAPSAVSFPLLLLLF